MRTTRGAVAVAALSAAGLLVSLGVAVPRMVPGPGDLTSRSPGTALDGSAVRPDASAPTPEGARPATGTGVAPVAPAEEVGRHAATPASPGRQGRTVPARMTMGAIDVSLPVRAVGVGADGQMALPSDPSVLGWYRFGPAPGDRDPGSSVLAGHLDSRRYGLGPLVRLRQARVGDPVRVTASDGTVTPYTVVGVRRFDRRALPRALFSRHGLPLLRIITCGGAFDPDRGYLQNLVVTAAPR